MAARRFFITTPIYYINAEPHLGHAYTSMVADAIARSRRLLDQDVFFLTGTDEHGQKVERAAQKAGLDTREFADRIAAKFRELCGLLNISNDDFIRTTEPRHIHAAQAIWRRVQERGYLYKAAYEGWYCTVDELFVPETQLLEGRRCPTCGNTVERLSEESYFFRLSQFTEPLLEHYRKHPEFITPENRRNEMTAFVAAGLKDLSVSRTSFKWGIPVPDDPAHVMYVWFDALTNYITAAGYGQPGQEAEFARWWPAVHLIGKDIIRFHCVYWPAMLLSAGLEPPRDWHVHGWLLVGGEKMSKTALNQIAPADLVADFGLDAYRYHFLADCPVGSDNDISYEAIVARYNADLANNLGNLLSRVATVVGTKCGGVGPAPSAGGSLVAAAATAAAEASAAWEAVQPSEALAATWHLIRATNAHLEANEPWKAEPGEAVDRVLGDALEALRIVTLLASPAIPDTAQTIWARIGLSGAIADQRVPEALVWGGYPGGLTVTKGAPLFPRRQG
jgi:methionyl-tRNA synthetase